MISELNEIMLHIRSFPYTDRIVFYTTLFNKVNIHGDNLRDLLIESYIADDNFYLFGKLNPNVHNNVDQKTECT
jgi:hypothetical protein